MVELSQDLNDSNTIEDDFKLPICFDKKRHTQKIEGIESITQSWRMKDRVKFKK